MTINVEQIGKNIKEWRTEAGISQYDLADMLQVHRQQITKWEAGTDMQISNLHKVAFALGMDNPLRLLDGVELELELENSNGEN